MDDPLSPDLRAKAVQLLQGLPDDGKDWYVEAVRPGHEDEARIYGSGQWGIAKPTPNTRAYRRPIATFIAAAPQLVRDLLTALDAAERRERTAFKDLLAALKLMESVYRLNCVAEGEPSSILAAAQAAIAKAEAAYTAYQAHAQTEKG